MQTTRFVSPIHPGVTQLDFTGPQQFFSRLPGPEVTVASLAETPVQQTVYSSAG